MKIGILLFVSIFLALNIYGQEVTISKKEQRALAKEQKKAEQAEQKEMKAKLVKNMLESQKFVLEADYIGNGKGQRIPVNSTINFVALDSTKAVLQIGSNQVVGWNGVGGVTVEGDLSKYKLDVIEGKKSISYNLTIVIMSSLGVYDVQFSISESGYTDATVRSTTSGQLKYTGDIVSLETTRVYKGMSRY